MEALAEKAQRGALHSFVESVPPYGCASLAATTIGRFGYIMECGVALIFDV